MQGKLFSITNQQEFHNVYCTVLPCTGFDIAASSGLLEANSIPVATCLRSCDRNSTMELSVFPLQSSQLTCQPPSTMPLMTYRSPFSMTLLKI